MMVLFFYYSLCSARKVSTIGDIYIGTAGSAPINKTPAPLSEGPAQPTGVSRSFLSR